MHCYQNFLRYHVKYKCSNFRAVKTTRRDETTLWDWRNYDHLTTIGQLEHLCWLVFNFSTYLGILFFHQLNLGVSDISTNKDTGFPQQHDGLFQQAGSVLKGGSVMY